MTGGGSSSGGGVSIRQPAEFRPEQVEILGRQADLINFQLDTLKQQKEVQSIFFAQAFPEEAALMFRREAEDLRRQATTFSNKAKSFREGRSLSKNNLLTSAALSQQQFGGGSTQSPFAKHQSGKNVDKIKEAQLKRGIGEAETAENNANVLLSRARLLEERADQISAAPPSARADFVKPLVSQRAIEGIGTSLEKALASRRQLGPVNESLPL